MSTPEVRKKQLISLVNELYDDRYKVEQWMNAELFALNYKKPIDMLHSDEDFAVVKKLVKELKHSVFSDD